MAMKQKIFLLVSLLFFIPLNAMATLWNIDPIKSHIDFTATQNGAPVKGSFTHISGTLDFDPNKLATSKASIIVSTAYIKTSYSDVATTLRTSPWFNVEAYPNATFTVNKFTHIKDNQYQADGNLTIRNKAVPITILFTLEQYTNDHALAKGTTTLHRSLFDVGTGEWADTNTVKDEVTVDFVIAAKG